MVGQDRPREDPLRIPQGVDWAVAWPIVDNDGVPVDLSNGYSARAQARHRAEDDDVLHEWSSEGTGPSIVLGADGKLTMHVPAVTSRSWTWRGAVYDVVLTAPDSSMFIVSQGGIEVDRIVTR